ncbi:MAG: SEL1-like repeat protein [Planctomycetota bacterium]|jgi:TPR repeat protein|nr:SEL1-like repeat protein [Planctomycetota bacterium]
MGSKPRIWLSVPALVLVLRLFPFSAAARAGDIPDALGEIIAKAEAGDVELMFRLGKAFMEGVKEKGIEIGRDPAQAVKWFERAGEAGNLEALGALVNIHGNGVGVSKDLKAAHKWTLKGAELGSADLQRQAGYNHKNGHGVPENPAEAEKWFRRASEQGDADAARQLGNLAFTRYENDNADKASLEKAFEWFKLAAERGDPDAQFNLGVFHNNGLGREKDYAEAGKWYERAARNRNPDAQYRLGMYSLEAKGGRERDLAQAKKWFALAAEGGHKAAADELAKIPAAVEKAADRPLRIDLARLAEEFAGDREKAEAAYAFKVLDIRQGESGLDVSNGDGFLEIKPKNASLAVLFRLAPRRGSERRTVVIGGVYRGFCLGVRDGRVLMEAVTTIADRDYDPDEADPVPEREAPAGSTNPGRENGGSPPAERADPFAGRWVGEYSDISGGDSWPLAIDKSRGMELPDEDILAEIGSFNSSNRIAALTVSWGEGEDERTAVFSGVANGGNWEGLVLVVENDDIVFRGTFKLERE